MQIGIDYSEVISEPEEPKSIGNSSTLPQDMKDLEKKCSDQPLGDKELCWPPIAGYGACP